eukprot:CAMPEP_0170458816 /NCGR_PEP_ID=MMETSP0123-20130129/5677_1 /TAXON_ID=182087 /ORGANISM="Favella ehrenbergii, Strain Fehren 1" /LENGTH=137 /DNA_ID=CAMNT_0010723125 /DNA_START=2205 /DNA_END=2617 /DNA_ORIENTATION=+
MATMKTSWHASRPPSNSLKEEDGNLMFDDDKKKKRGSAALGDLPKSMVEKYGSEIKLSRKELRRLQNAKKPPKDDFAIASSQADEVVAPDAEDKRQETKWDKIYGATSSKMSDLISKQVGKLDAKKLKKAKKGSKKQ